MKVLLANHVDLGGGGASVAGFRLHRQLQAAGAESRLLVGSKSAERAEPSVLRTPGLVRRPLHRVAVTAGLNDLDGVAAYRIRHHEAFRWADVVHYHAIHGNWFSYPAMARATAGKPSVLTLHDQWPLTGHCAFSFECERWRHGCGSCPHLDAFPSVERDNTALEWRLKRRTWQRSQLTLVSPSRWLADLSRSSILGHFPVEVIPHGIDTETFAPGDPEAARAALGLGDAEAVIGFAASSVEDRRKGFDLAVAALGRLPEAVRRRMTVVLMGGSSEALAGLVEAAGCRAVPLGYVPGDRLKALVYSAADAFVLPTRADNSPLVALEAMACGTAVVAFAVGGVPELVRPEVTGLLAEPEDVAGMAAAVHRLVEDPATAAKLGAGGRSLVLEEHTEEVAAARHLELYSRLLAGS